MSDFPKQQKAIQYEKFVFSDSAAARILDIDAFKVLHVIKGINETHNVCTIDHKVYQVPNSEFYRNFVFSRQQRSKQLSAQATAYSNVWIVTNPKNRKRYPVRATADSIECKCRDYQKQQEILGKGCCKHGYRILNYLGYQDLKAYMNRNSAIAA